MAGITIDPGTPMGPHARGVFVLDPRTRLSKRVGTLDPDTAIYQMGGLGKDLQPRWKRLVWYENEDGKRVTYVSFAPESWTEISNYARDIELVRPELEDDKVFHVSVAEAQLNGRWLATALGKRWGVPWPWEAGRVGEHTGRLGPISTKKKPPPPPPSAPSLFGT